MNRRRCVGEGADQVGIVDVFDRDPGLGDDHQRQFFDRGYTSRRNAEGRDHDEMRSGHGVPQGDLPLEASRHASVQVVAEQEGVVGQVLDDELVAMACGRKLLDLADEQHETARAGAGRRDPADGAQVALRQLRLALGRKHFRDVEHIRERRALGGLVLRGVAGGACG